MVDVVGEVPGQHGGHAGLQEGLVVAAALKGVHQHLKVGVHLLDHLLGGRHVEVVNEVAADVHGSDLVLAAGAPQGVGVGLADELAGRAGGDRAHVGTVHGVGGVVIVGGGIGGLLNPHGAAGLLRVLAHHVQVDGADHVGELLLVGVLPQVGELILIAPEKSDGAVGTGDDAVVDHLLHLDGQLHIEAHAGSVVVGAGLLHVGEDQHPLFGVDRALDLGHGSELALGGGVALIGDGIDGAHTGHVHLHGHARVQQVLQRVVLV